MTNNNWNTVNWDKIPDDVDAVVTFAYDEPSYYKTVDGELQVQCFRDYSFECSSYRDTESAIEACGDRFHLRPTPTTQPTVEHTSEPTESTQVESSEVEVTTTPEFDWSSVEDDVEAVIVSKGKIVQWLKTEDGHLLRTRSLGIIDWEEGYYKTLDDREKNMCDYYDKGAKLLRRPPATTPPEVDMYSIFKSVESKPLISTILQEAQQSILKHHGVTGKVKFTVTCS